MKPLSPRILIIDDDPNICELLRLMLQYSNPDYEITCVSTPQEGLSLAATQGFDLYVLDYRFRGINGIDVCRALRQTHAETRIMFFTGETRDHKQREAIQAGADAYLVKPDNLPNLTETVNRLLGMPEPATMRDMRQQEFRSESLT